MDKTYHFLAGLPRSGNTLLSALLNQNPEIYSTPLSPLPTFMWEMDNTAKGMEQVQRNAENEIKTEIFLSSFLDNFYKEIEKPVIIEREKAWGTPANLNIVKKYITPTPKIIYTVRDILDILASFVTINPDYINREIQDTGYYIGNYRSLKDLTCEHLMSLNGPIDKSLLALAPAFWPENKGMYHIVEYNDLVQKPDETMTKLYEFLEMPYYKHNFTKIKKIEIDRDEEMGLPKNLHEVKQSLSESPTTTDVLSDYIKHKYSNMEFWRKESLMKVRGKDF